MANISKRLRFEVLRRDNFACGYCGARSPGVKLVVDAVVPEALGGSHKDPANLITACEDCNNGKGSTTPDGAIIAHVSRAALRWRKAENRRARRAALLARVRRAPVASELVAPSPEPSDRANAEPVTPQPDVEWARTPMDDDASGELRDHLTGIRERRRAERGTEPCIVPVVQSGNGGHDLCPANATHWARFTQCDTGHHTHWGESAEGHPLCTKHAVEALAGRLGAYGERLTVTTCETFPSWMVNA